MTKIGHITVQPSITRPLSVLMTMLLLVAMLVLSAFMHAPRPNDDEAAPRLRRSRHGGGRVSRTLFGLDLFDWGTNEDEWEQEKHRPHDNAVTRAVRSDPNYQQYRTALLKIYQVKRPENAHITDKLLEKRMRQLLNRRRLVFHLTILPHLFSRILASHQSLSFNPTSVAPSRWCETAPPFKTFSKLR